MYEGVILPEAKSRAISQSYMLHVDRTAMLYMIYCLLMTAFLLMFAILYFMRMRITSSKAHA